MIWPVSFTADDVVGVHCLTAARVCGEDLMKLGDTHVKQGVTVFGSRYKTVRGPCYRCGQSGYVHGEICHRCGGTGEYRRTSNGRTANTGVLV